MKAFQRDWVGFEIPAIFVILVGGAVLRYGLSTVVPFDATELAQLAEANVRNRGGRVPFIMFNGISLLMFYLFTRRSAGVAAAFALLLSAQTSLTFQEKALRIHWSSAAILVGMLVLTYWRHTLPAWRAPRVIAVAAVLLTALLGMRGLYLGVTLPARLEAIRDETTGDVGALYDSLVACGGGDVTPLEVLRDCQLVWPSGRSLDQQEAMLIHAQIVPSGASVLDGNGPLPDPDPDSATFAVFDREGGVFFLVEEGEMEATARRAIGLAP